MVPEHPTSRHCCDSPFRDLGMGELSGSYPEQAIPAQDQSKQFEFSDSFTLMHIEKQQLWVLVNICGDRN